jgi:Ca2+/Na+ antiporter
MVGHTGFLLCIVAAAMAIILAYVHKSDSAVLTLTLFALSLTVFLVAAEQFSKPWILRISNEIHARPNCTT